MKTSARLLRRDTSQFAMLCQAALQRGSQVRFLAHGQSMQPNVLNGDAVIAEPVGAQELRRGDIALTLGAHGVLLHRVIGLDAATNRIVTRGDAGQQNDTPAELVLGRAVCIERGGKRISLQTPGTKLLHALRRQYRRIIQAGARRSSRLRGILAPLLCAFFALCFYASPAAAQFTISDSVAPTNVAPGGTVVYTQVLTATANFTPSAGTPAKTTQAIPSGLTYVSVAITGTASTHWGCAVAAGTLTCTDTSGAVIYHNTNTTTFTITMTVLPTTTNGNITDSVTSTPGGSNATATITVSTPALSVTGSAAPNPVATGAQITYTETVTNNSTTTAANGATLTQSTPPIRLSSPPLRPADGRAARLRRRRHWSNRLHGQRRHGRINIRKLHDHRGREFRRAGWNHDHKQPSDRQRNGNEPGNPKQHLDLYHSAGRRSFHDASRLRARCRARHDDHLHRNRHQQRPERGHRRGALSTDAAQHYILFDHAAHRMDVRHTRHRRHRAQSCAPPPARWLPTPPADRSPTSSQSPLPRLPAPPSSIPPT